MALIVKMVTRWSVGCAVQCRLQFGIERALLSIGDDDQPAHLTVTEHQPDHIKNVIVLAHHVTHSHIVDEELAEMGIGKGLGVELRGINRRGEIAQLAVGLLMDPADTCVVCDLPSARRPPSKAASTAH